MKSSAFVFLLVFVGFFSTPSEARRGRFLSHQGHIKGFNPCGWNTCRTGSGFRRPLRRGIIFRRRVFRGGCNQGGCGQGACNPGGCGSSRGGCQGGSCQQGPAQPSFQDSGNTGHADNGSFDDDSIEAPSLDPAPQRAEAPPTPPESGNASDTLNDEQKAGALVFKSKCATCHEDNGPGPNFKDWTEAEWKEALRRSHLGNNDKERMPPLKKPALSEEELKALKAFLETKTGTEKSEAAEDSIEAPGFSDREPSAAGSSSSTSPSSSSQTLPPSLPPREAAPHQTPPALTEAQVKALQDQARKELGDVSDSSRFSERDLTETFRELSLEGQGLSAEEAVKHQEKLDTIRKELRRRIVSQLQSLPEIIQHDLREALEQAPKETTPEERKKQELLEELRRRLPSREI